MNVEKYVNKVESNLKAPGADYGRISKSSISNKASGDLLAKILQNDLPLNRMQKHYREKLQRDANLQVN